MKEINRNEIRERIENSRFLAIFNTLSKPNQKEFKQFALVHFEDKKTLFHELIENLANSNLSEKNIETLTEKIIADNKYYNRHLTDLTHFLQHYIVFSQLTNEDKTITEANLLKDLTLIKYYRERKAKLIEKQDILADALQNMRSDLDKFPQRDWQYHYYNYKYWTYELEFCITNDDSQGRDERIRKSLEACNQAFNAAWAGEYFYRMLISTPAINAKMPFTKGVQVYLETEEYEQDFWRMLLEVSELLKTDAPHFSLEKCLQFFPSDNPNAPQTSLQRQFSLLSIDARQNICRLFIAKYNGLANKDAQYYSDAFDYHLECFRHNYLLIQGFLYGREYRNLLICYMYKYENEAYTNRNNIYAWLKNQIDALFPNIKIYEKSSLEEIKRIVIARFLLEHNAFEEAMEKANSINKKSLYYFEGLLLALYAQFGEDVANFRKYGKRNFTETQNVYKDIPHRIAKLNLSPKTKILCHDSLLLLGLLLAFAKKAKSETKIEIGQFLEQKDKKIYLRYWLKNQLNEL